MEPTKKLPPAVVTIIVIVLIGALAAGVAILRSQSDQSPTSGTSTSVTPPQSSSQASAAYQNGTYTATGTYVTPGGRESITLTVTLDNERIADASLQQNAKTEQAKEYQQRFASGYKERVIGKDIDEVSLVRVAGSSLTSSGFHDALEQIKIDASV